MTDPLPEEGPSGSKWLWVGVIVLLAVASIIFFLNADGDEELETIPDEAVTTTEERLNTDLAPADPGDLPPVTGQNVEPVDGADMMAEPRETPE